MQVRDKNEQEMRGTIEECKYFGPEGRTERTEIGSL